MAKTPVEWTEITLEELESTPQLRWTDCPFYEQCLEIVTGDENWASWTCFLCSYQDNHRWARVEKEIK